MTPLTSIRPILSLLFLRSSGVYDHLHSQKWWGGLLDLAKVRDDTDDHLRENLEALNEAIVTARTMSKTWKKDKQACTPDQSPISAGESAK